MSKFFYEGETDRLDLGDGEWAEIKLRMTYGDQQRVTGQYIKLQSRIARGTAEDADASIEMETGQLALLEANIVDWSLKDGKGAKLSITRDSLRRLWPEVAQSLLAEIGKRNPAYPFAKVG